MNRTVLMSLTAAAMLLGGGMKYRDVRPAAKAPAAPKQLPFELHGGGRDLRPRVMQASLFSGTTNVGISPEVTFNVRNASATVIQQVASSLEANARFVDDAGRAVAAVASFKPSNVPSYDYELSLAPLEVLRADTWYTLELRPDASMVVGSHEDATTVDAAGPRGIRLFTGSAPRIRRIVRTAHPSKPVTEFAIVMSEPVQLGTVAQALAVEAGGLKLEGCVAWERGCVSSGDRTVTDAFSFRLAVPSNDKAPQPLAVTLDGAVRGRGRSVAEGAAVSGADARGGRLVTAFAASAWKSCSSSNDVLCWRGSEL